MKIDLKELFSFDNSFDEKSVNALLKALNDAHLEEFDYLKFKASVQNLLSLNMDENTSIRSTFATAQTLGVTKDYVLKTIDHYINVIGREKSNFSEALKKTLDNSINTKIKDSDTLRVNINKFEQKIVELQNAIQEGKTKLQNVDSEIEEIKNKIETTKNEFQKAITHLETTMSDDKSKISNIL